MKSMNEERIVSVVAGLCLVLALCSGQDFNCTVTRSGHTTTYKVQGWTRSSEYKDSSCYYSWMDANERKLADNNNSVSSVVENSLNLLVTTDCVETIICKQQCTSQSHNILKDFLANCTTSCAEVDHGDGKKLIGDEDGQQTLWILIGLVVLGLVVLGVLSVFLRDKFRSCFQSGVRYVLGKTEDTDPNPPVVLEMT